VGTIEFNAALEAFLFDGGYSENLLHAAAMTLGCTIPLEPERAVTIAELTGSIDEIVDYHDASVAIRLWFATLREPGPRH
jgi:hypothetical protein